MKIKLLGVLCLLNLFMGYSQQKNYDKEIEQLLSKMTLEEKIGQMNQLNFNGMSEELVLQIKKNERIFWKLDAKSLIYIKKTDG